MSDVRFISVPESMPALEVKQHIEEQIYSILGDGDYLFRAIDEDHIGAVLTNGTDRLEKDYDINQRLAKEFHNIEGTDWIYASPDASMPAWMVLEREVLIEQKKKEKRKAIVAYYAKGLRFLETMLSEVIKPVYVFSNPLEKQSSLACAFSIRIHSDLSILQQKFYELVPCPQEYRNTFI